MAVESGDSGMAGRYRSEAQVAVRPDQDETVGGDADTPRVALLGDNIHDALPPAAHPSQVRVRR